MKLYHYTALYFLPSIKEEGTLRVTESNLSLTVPHAGPDVVWLTSRDAWAQPWQRGASIDKGEWRIVVDVSDALPWVEWARAHGMSRSDRRAMVATDSHWREWYVVDRPIPDSEWLYAHFRPDIQTRLMNDGTIPPEAIRG